MNQTNRCLSIGFVIFCLLCINSLSLADSTRLTLSSTNLSERSDELHESPDIAVDNKKIYVVWTAWHHEFDSEILVRKSIDSGKSWGSIRSLSQNSSTAVYPAIAVSDAFIHVVWRDSVDEFPVIKYRRSSDYGKSWEAAVDLVDNRSRKTNLYDVDVIVEDRYVFVVWKDYRTGSSEVFLKRSEDNGSSWSSDMRLTRDYSPSYAPSLSVEGGHLLVCYEDGGTASEICVLRSDDYGKSWSEKKYLTGTNLASESPYVSIVNTTSYIVWQDERDGDSQIFLRRSFDFGMSWDKEQMLSNGSQAAFNPRLYIVDDHIFVIWQQQEQGELHLYYVESFDGGNQWSDVELLFDEGDLYDVVVGGSGSDVYVVWQRYDEPGAAPIFFGRGDQSTPIHNEINESPSFLSVNFILVMLFIFALLYRKTKK